MPVFFPIIEAIFIDAFFYNLQFLQRFSFYLLNWGISQVFEDHFQFLKLKKKSHGARSGEYGGEAGPSCCFGQKKYKPLGQVSCPKHLQK